MITKIDFRRFRTYGALAWAIFEYLPHKVTRTGRTRCMCPRPGCPGNDHETLVVHRGWAVGYCHGCHRTIDALEITMLAIEGDYNQAARILIDAGFGG